jgi:hypothetical protein
LRAVKPDKWVEREERARIDQMSPAGGDIERPDLRALVLAGDLRIEGIRRLKPGSGGGEVEMKAVRLVGLPIEAVEKRLGIAAIVEGQEFRSIEKPSRVARVKRREVSPMSSTGALS